MPDLLPSAWREPGEGRSQVPLHAGERFKLGCISSVVQIPRWSRCPKPSPDQLPADSPASCTYLRCPLRYGVDVVLLSCRTMTGHDLSSSVAPFTHKHHSSKPSYAHSLISGHACVSACLCEHALWCGHAKGMTSASDTAILCWLMFGSSRPWDGGGRCTCPPGIADTTSPIKGTRLM